MFDLHPLIGDWFTSRFDEPTEPQRRAWPALQSGRDVLITAPTGSGKTLAAFWSAWTGWSRRRRRTRWRIRCRCSTFRR